jgi:hypothetical protein
MSNQAVGVSFGASIGGKRMHFSATFEPVHTADQVS